MNQQIQSFTRLVAVYMLVSCLSIFAQADGVSALPPGIESYLSRPDILTVQPQAKNSEPEWESLKKAHFSFLAEILELYPNDTHFYFLARDSELLYDVARLVTNGTEESSRVHLINVSRGNMHDPHLKAYLGENGISEQELRNGKSVLFVDTGFEGTIPSVISKSFPEELHSQLKTQLIVSSNNSHPSSLSFLVRINPLANEHDPSAMHSSIIAYEHMPRYTNRSHQFLRVNDRYHPVGRTDVIEDGAVSKEKSLEFMQDLVAEWQRPQVRARFAQERRQFKTVKNVLSNPNPKNAEKLADLLETSKGSENGRNLEAKIRDVIDIHKNAGFQVTYSLEDFDLKAGHRGAKSKKQILIEKYPEWKPVLQNPEDEIPKLVQGKKWQMIANLIDADVDFEFHSIIAKHLFKDLATGIQKDLQLTMIKKTEYAGIFQKIILQVFLLPAEKQSPEILSLLIEKADNVSAKTLFRDVFSKEVPAHLDPYYTRLIERYIKDDQTMDFAARFSLKNANQMNRLPKIQYLLEHGSQTVLVYVCRELLKNSDLFKNLDLVEILVRRATQDWLKDEIRKVVFSHPEAQTPRHKQLEASLKIPSLIERTAFLEMPKVHREQPTAAKAGRKSSMQCKKIFSH